MTDLIGSFRPGKMQDLDQPLDPFTANNRIVEIKSSLILQPGPAALTDGLDAVLAASSPSTDTVERLSAAPDACRRARTGQGRSR